jgi:Spy/CpxP family protein refolding chaperone
MFKARFAILAASALALTLAVAPVLAQGQGGQRRGGGRGVSLATLPIKTLDSVLTLTADQKTKVTAIQEKYAADVKPLRPAQGQPADPANTAKLRELSQQATKDIEAVLTDEQKTKWADARKEFALYTLAGIPAPLYGEVKLTGDQKTKLEAIQKETTEKLQGAPQDQRRTINQDARQKAGDILTADQKAAVEKYNKEHPRQGRRQP